jgi:hypothetical protein
MVGGWLPGITNAEHWRLPAGSSVWVQLPDFPGEARHTHVQVVWQGRLYIVGGDANSGHYQPNAWSYDGSTWTRHADLPSALGNRALMYGAAIESGPGAGIYAMGGQTFVDVIPAFPEAFYQDVWKATDLGVYGGAPSDWVKVLDPAPWAARGMICGTATLNNEIYLMGGGTYDTTAHPTRLYYADCWKTADGVNWTALGTAPWRPRSYHSVAAIGGLLYVSSGAIPPSTGVEIADCWTSPTGMAADWTEQSVGQFGPRHAAALCARLGQPYFGSGTWQLHLVHYQDEWAIS